MAMNRRQFITRGAAAGAAASAAFSINARGANEKVVVGLMGLRYRGSELHDMLVRHPKVEVAHIADVDTNLFKWRLREIKKTGQPAPECHQDFRRILENKDVDALAIATPDHWHALAAILGAQAGKHVYVEKPVSHNIWEGRQMVAAAKKYGIVMQAGLQNRSMPCALEAREFLRSRDFGDIHLVRVMNDKMRPPVAPGKDQDPPPGVDYDMWLGPAKERPFNTNHFHYTWHWFWQYSGGDIMNDGVHQFDLVRFLLGQEYPTSVYSSGGSFYFKDAQETPDTHLAHFQFPGLMMEFEQALWTPYMKKDPHENLDKMPPWRFNGTRIVFFGSKQQMVFARHGGGWEVWDADGNTVHKEDSKRQDEQHIDNFVRAIREGAELNTPIEEGHKSTLLCHYANISYRLGGVRLDIDPRTEGFKNNGAANRDLLAKRAGRAPWVVPEEV